MLGARAPVGEDGAVQTPYVPPARAREEPEPAPAPPGRGPHRGGRLRRAGRPPVAAGLARAAGVRARDLPRRRRDRGLPLPVGAHAADAGRALTPDDARGGRAGGVPADPRGRAACPSARCAASRSAPGWSSSASRSTPSRPGSTCASACSCRSSRSPWGPCWPGPSSTAPSATAGWPGEGSPGARVWCAWASASRWRRSGSSSSRRRAAGSRASGTWGSPRSPCSPAPG